MHKSENRQKENVEKTQTAVNSLGEKRKEELKAVIVRTEDIKEGLQKSHLLYDKAGKIR